MSDTTPTIGIVGEGAADFTVLQYILAGYFRDPDIDPHPLQPIRDATHTFADGGWHQVLEYCQSEQFRGAFADNEYVIIQIDTDVSEAHPAYNIPHRDATGRLYTCDELVKLVQTKLIEQIGRDFYAAHHARILFAICVHSLECWLLPLYWTDSRRGRTENCLKSLNEQLAKKGFTIHAKEARYYVKVAKPYAKHSTLREHWKHNPSFKIFIDNLEQEFHRGLTG